MKGICFGEAPEASGSNVDPIEFIVTTGCFSDLGSSSTGGNSGSKERRRRSLRATLHLRATEGRKKRVFQGFDLYGDAA
jgi:hypothetical protein